MLGFRASWSEVDVAPLRDVHARCADQLIELRFEMGMSHTAVITQVSLLHPIIEQFLTGETPKRFLGGHSGASNQGEVKP
jgi:hypothetical protein